MITSSLRYYTSSDFDIIFVDFSHSYRNFSVATIFTHLRNLKCQSGSDAPQLTDSHAKSMQDLSNSTKRNRPPYQNRGQTYGAFESNTISGSSSGKSNGINNRLKNMIDPVPSSSQNRNPASNNNLNNELSFGSPQPRRFSEVKRQQQQQVQQQLQSQVQQQLQRQQLHLQQQQQQNLRYGVGGAQSHGVGAKYTNARKDGSAADTRTEGVSTYKQNSIRNIVSRGREGIFFDEARETLGNSGTIVEAPLQTDDSEFDSSGKRNNGSTRVQRRHDARRRHRQQPSVGTVMAPIITTSQSASATIVTALPKLGAATIGLQLNSSTNNSLSQKSVSVGNNGAINRGRQQQPYQQNQATPQALPSVRPQLQLPYQSGVSHQQESQSGLYQPQPAPSQVMIAKDTLAIYHEDHSPQAAVTSIKGLKPGNPNWKNQDNFFVIENVDGRSDVSIYCVLDGHGEHGHHVSRRTRENFPQHIKSSNYDVKRAFYNMQNELCTCEYDVRCSGATCVLAILNGNRLSVSNCGDSRAVLGRRNSNGSVSAFPLSSDHKPDQPEERKRILACGGHVGCRHVLVQGEGRGGPVSMPVGPCRVWYQNRGETLGLAMSRSLGDSVVHRCGVSAEPETFEHSVCSQDEFLIIATDGVWDVLDNNFACQIVLNAMTSASSSSSATACSGPAGSSSGWPLEAANNIAAGTATLHCIRDCTLLLLLPLLYLTFPCLTLTVYFSCLSFTLPSLV